MFTFDNELFDESNINKILKEYGNRIRFSPGLKPVITLKLNEESEDQILKETKDFLKIY